MNWLLLLSAGAQTSPEVSGQLFRPSIDSQKTWWTDDSHKSRNGYVLARGVLHYANKPVVYSDSNGDLVNVVSDVLQLSMLGGFTTGPVRFGLDVPIYLQTAGIEGKEAGLGDVAVDVKATLLDPETKVLGLAVAGRIGLPTTTVDASLGSRGVSWEVSAIADKSFDQLLLAVNVGTRGIPGQDLNGFRWDDQFQARVGVGYGKVEGSGVSLDVGSHINYANTSPGSLPAEAILGGWTRVARDIRLRGGVGSGLTTGFGAPQFRLLAGIAYEPPQAGDADKDGLVDTVDACPNLAEDLDRYEDSDGCPEPTLVRVKILDPSGKTLDGSWTLAEKTGGADGSAMLAAGHYDLRATSPGFAPNTAAVTIPDGAPHTVQITLQPEAKPTTLLVRVTGPDGRAISKARWTFRGEAVQQPIGEAVAVEEGEVWVRAEAAGYRPQTGKVRVTPGAAAVIEISLTPAKVELTGGRIDIKDSIFFETSKAVIKGESFELLSEVAQILKDHPELSQVRVEGHTDSRGSAEYNLYLSGERAASVRAYLIDMGVAPERLVSQGFGESKPLDTRENTEAWTTNRRVDFFVTERSD